MRLSPALLPVVGITVLVLLLAACGGGRDVARSSSSTPASPLAMRPTDSPGRATQPSPGLTDAPSTPASPPTNTPTDSTTEPSTAEPVEAGTRCGNAGATAVMADGATATCSLLEGTDLYVWSRPVGTHPDSPAPPSPQPPATIPTPTAPAVTAPSVGSRCFGYQIGMATTDASGRQVVCDDYSWRAGNAEPPTHPWVDDQGRQPPGQYSQGQWPQGQWSQEQWQQCIATHSIGECQASLPQPTG
ncbi:hypothetical protein [Gordonia jinhuaensis]|nr:hypothetical protein [Gordonia jinhuaensis]